MNNGLNGKEIVYKEGKTIHQLFEEQVERTPDKPAVIYKKDCFTYRELNEKSNQLARKLREEGIRPNEIAALMVKRNVNMMVGIIAVIKAGGCYLPVDDSYPVARINYMLEDSKAKIIITDDDMNPEIKFHGKRISIEDNSLRKYDVSNLKNFNTAKDLIYIIYTSGSTSKPKGVMIQHKSVHNFIIGMIDKIDFSHEKTIVSLTTISFDIFVLESLLPLVIGMNIVIANPMNFAKDVGEHKINMVQTTPSTLRLILNDKRNTVYFRNLTEIMVGGEAFPRKLLYDLKNYSNAKIYNMYGPTETTVWSTVKELTDCSKITIGYPICNTQIYIIDKEEQVLSDGQEGELCIAGDGLAKGYFGMEELTKEKFCVNPAKAGQLMYKTGDIAKILPDGDIEYLGRNDSVVKIRGFRIGVGEIEDCLRLNSNITECAVLPLRNEWEETYLVCYYVSEENITITDIIMFLRKELPEYMIPGVYIKVDKIPLTPNGKINRKLLPEPNRDRPQLETFYISPNNKLENEISMIWRKILNLNLIGVNDNFFQLGGNSILLCQMHLEIEKIYPGKIDLVDIFANPTVKTLCKLIKDKETNESRIKKIPVIQLHDQYYHTCNKSQREVILHGEIEQESLMKLLKYTKDLEIDFFNLLLGTYMYILSQNSLSSKVELVSVAHNNQLCKRVSLDFINMNDLEKISKSIYLLMQNQPSYDINMEGSLDSMIKNKKFTIPFFFFNSNRIEHKDELYGLNLFVREDNTGAKFMMVFCESKLNKETIEEMFLRYLNLLKKIANQL